jgi:acetyltransferase AlgX (SGNH hydrolase-like protein)
MKRLLNPKFGLILFFLGIIVSIPVVQMVVEACRGERPQALEIFKRKPTAGNLRAYERRLEDASWVAAKLRPWAQYAQFAWLKDGGEKSLVGRDGWLFYKPSVEYATGRPDRHGTTTTASDAVAAIIDLRNQLATRGIRLLVMPAPDKESVYPEKLTRRAAGLRTAMSAETQEVLSQLKAAEVEVVDLFELFAAAKAAGPASSPPLYLAQDSHWSPAGAELAARAAARRILNQGSAHLGSVAYEIKPSPVERVGDILRMLQVPQLERNAVAEKVSCYQVLRRDTLEPYRDDGGSEILVLGDSFLRIYETDEPGGGGFIAHLARELRQPVTSIVNDGGASTLVRQELSRRPAFLANKKVVIWEFVERDIRLGVEGWQRVPLPAEKEHLP